MIKPDKSTPSASTQSLPKPPSPSQNQNTTPPSPTHFNPKINNTSTFTKSQDIYQSVLHFAIGGLSGAFATLIIQPIDTLKVQVQVVSEQKGKNIGNKLTFLYNVLKHIHNEKGFAVLYRGLGSAIWRQIYYASARLGSYTWAVQKCKNKGIKIGLAQKVGLSAFSGIFGAIIGNPFDVALIRRQASVTTGKNAYKSTMHAFSSIVKDEGFLKLWRGLDITMLRVLLINVGQLAGNQIITQILKPFFLTKTQSQNPQTKQTYRTAFLHNISAILASALTAFLSLPADNIKVKLQKQTPDNILYNGIYDCFRKTVQRQGFTRLWVGFVIYLIRGMPHSFVLIRTQQFLKSKLLGLNPQ